VFGDNRITTAGLVPVKKQDLIHLNSAVRLEEYFDRKDKLLVWRSAAFWDDLPAFIAPECVPL